MASAVINAVRVPPSPPSPSFLPLWISPNPSSSSTADAAEAPPEFEFHSTLSTGSTMLPADELFSGGFLLPLHLRTPTPDPTPAPDPPLLEASRSPKAPRCSYRWKELFGLKRAAIRAAAIHRNPNPNSNTRIGKSRTSKPAPPTETLPLLRDHDAIAKDTSTPPSPQHQPPAAERARPTVDAPADRSRAAIEKLKAVAERGRVARREVSARCLSLDSPRMSSSGKVVFQNLGRSSSSPGSFAGTGRRSFSGANVAPVLNVPAAFGLGQFFSSPQKRDTLAGGGFRTSRR